MANDLLRGRQVVVPLTNKSGGGVVEGDVVILSSGTAAAFTTTTTAALATDMVGVAIETIANDGTGRVCIGGYIAKINLSSSASLGDSFGTHTVAKQGVAHATMIGGDFGEVLGTGTTPAALLWGGMPKTAAGTGDVAGPASATDGHLVVFDGTTGKLIKDGGAVGGGDGWITAGETWTYSSADGPTGVFTVAADVTGKYSPGMRVKLTQTDAKYGIITGVSAYSAPNTTITIYMGTDYTLANAAITAPYYSTHKAPFGFPLSPVKWTVEYTDTSNRTQATPGSGTWYNINTASLSIPIGVWDVSYSVMAGIEVASTADRGVYTTLSTANNSESDKKLSCVFYSHMVQPYLFFRARAQYPLVLAAKATYYLNTKTDLASATTLFNQNSDETLFIRAVCGYL